MADTALSNLSSASALDGTELYYTVQSNADRKATGAQIRTLVIDYLTGNPNTFSARQTFTASNPGITVGSNGGNNGAIKLFGSSTGDVTIQPNSVSSTGIIFQLPANQGGTNSVLALTNSATGQIDFVALAGGGDMLAANNLSDVANSVTAFTNIKQIATTASTGVIEIATTTEAAAGTDSARAVTPQGLSSATIMQGRHIIGLPASAWRPKASGGATSSTYQDIPTLVFSGTASQRARTTFRWPKSWDESTISFAVSGVIDSGGTTGHAVYTLAGKCFGHDDAAWTTGALTTGVQSVAVPWTADDDLLMSGFSSQITLDGTPTEGDLVVLELCRDTSAASDNNTAEMHFVELSLKYGVNQATDS